jgi:hypothetical protein
MASFPPAGGNANSVRSDVPKACKATLRPSNHIVQRVDCQYVSRSVREESAITDEEPSFQRDSRTASSIRTGLQDNGIAEVEQLDPLNVEQTCPLGLITQDVLKRASGVLLAQKEIDRLRVRRVRPGRTRAWAERIAVRRSWLLSELAEPQRRSGRARGASEAAVCCALARHSLIPRHAAPARHIERSRGDLSFRGRRCRPGAGSAGWRLDRTRRKAMSARRCCCRLRR